MLSSSSPNPHLTPPTSSSTATYHVLIEGTGIDLPTDEHTRVAGFYVWRVERAANEELAATQALDRVSNEWSTGRYSGQGARPVLAVAEVRVLSWLASLRAKDSGCVFYPPEQLH